MIVHTLVPQMKILVMIIIVTLLLLGMNLVQGMIIVGQIIQLLKVIHTHLETEV